MRNVVVVLVLSLIIGLPAYADSHDDVANEVIALARAEWAASIEKDMEKRLSYLADEYTEFNQGYPTRIDGAWKLVHANFASGD